MQDHCYFHIVSLIISHDILTHNLAIDSFAAGSPYGHLHSQYKAVIFNFRKYFLGKWAGELWSRGNSGRSAVKHAYKSGQIRI